MEIQAALNENERGASVSGRVNGRTSFSRKGRLMKIRAFDAVREYYFVDFVEN